MSTEKVPSKLSTLQGLLLIYEKITSWIVQYTELFFYNLGKKIGAHPKATILLCWLLVIVSAFGYFRFHQEKNPLKLWVPPGSKYLEDTNWLLGTFQRGFREEALIVKAPNVLTPQVLEQLLDIHEQISSSSVGNITWKDVCFSVPKINSLMKTSGNGNGFGLDFFSRVSSPLACIFVNSMKVECLEQSILALWDFNRNKIMNLTTEDIIESVNNYQQDVVFGRFKDYLGLLSGVQRNESGAIVSATALHNVWMTNVNFSEVDMDKAGNAAGTADWASVQLLEWETEFSRILDNVSHYTNNISIHYMSARSFGDASSATMFQDMGKLCIGVIIMVIYVQFVISKYNWLEARLLLGGMGLLAIGMAFVVGVGLASMFGIFYGPVHTSLPFLLMGLGVDDMFVIMACWDDLTKQEKALPMPERIGLILKHGGVSITVTSLTDVLAFIIGSSTILPSLESYCLYAALSVFMTYIFAITFFTACFAIDQKRVDDKRNGILPCIKYGDDYTPNKRSQKQVANKMFRWVYSKVIFTIPGKLTVILVALVCLGFAISGCLKLEQRFDPQWLIPESSVLNDYLNQRKQYYPSIGFEAGFYLGSVNYTHEMANIQDMVLKLENSSDIVTDIISWVEPFQKFVYQKHQIDIFNTPLPEKNFSLYLSKFLFSPMNAKYQANFQFEKPIKCGKPAPKIILSIIDFRFVIFSGPEYYLPAMHRIQNIADNSNLTTGDGKAIAWSKIFATWEVDEIIATEVMRNLELTLLCVMICTFVLLADLQTCFWVFICVLMTMVNVCGFMQYWGMTIDTVACIGLELGIGLCVDYASHIGHTYLTVTEGTRTERSYKTVESIGSAVLYGGFSTLIGVFMLSQSDAYIFQSFFKIFILVILFGLYHGVVLLPVLFTWLGPKPYKLYMKPDSKISEMKPITHCEDIKLSGDLEERKLTSGELGLLSKSDMVIK